MEIKIVCSNCGEGLDGKFKLLFEDCGIIASSPCDCHKQPEPPKERKTARESCMDYLNIREDAIRKEERGRVCEEIINTIKPFFKAEFIVDIIQKIRDCK